MRPRQDHRQTRSCLLRCCAKSSTPFTLMRFEYGCTRFSSIRFSVSFSRSRNQFLYVCGMLTVRSRRLGGYCGLVRFWQRSVVHGPMWSDRHGWHTVITELSRCTHGWPRFRRGHARCTHEYTRWARGYLRIFAVALRIFAFSTRVSRRHYGYYVIDGSNFYGV